MTVPETLGFSRGCFGYIVSKVSSTTKSVTVGAVKFYLPLSAYETEMGLVVKSKQDLHAYLEYM